MRQQVVKRQNKFDAWQKRSLIELGSRTTRFRETVVASHPATDRSNKKFKLLARAQVLAIQSAEKT